ncbi:histidine kinase dimerization/phospho-acceptor domain-containing protein [Apirhabdus apintestini]|nr:histidine kinase dimerization/phospho-acceptor domain-containing protein [Enterobacteriaceae bacterium CA-0114]
MRSGQPGSISLYLPYLIALAAIFVAIVFYVRRRAVLLRALDVIPTPAWLSDRRGRLIAGNPALQKALGTDSAALRGKPLVTWLPGVQEHNSGDTQIIRYADRVLRLWHAPVKGQRYLIGGWLDVTRQSQMIQALRTAKRKADSASRVKSVFLATMSHEIRTPISAIIGMLELVMRRRGDTEQNRQSVRIAWEAAQSLLLLIGNILDVSRIESGRLVLRPERASLRTLIESSAILFDGLAAQKGLRFMLEIDAGLNDDVLIDTMRFRQIIVNLVGNAIKFT